MAQMLKGTTDLEIASRSEIAFKEAVDGAGNSCKHLDSLRTRLDFQNVDSEAESFLGGSRQTGGKEARDTRAREQWRDEPREPQRDPKSQEDTAQDQADEGQAGPSERDSFFRSGRAGRDEDEHFRPRWSRGGSYMGLSSLLRGWGQMRANHNGWPMFNKRLMNYPRFKKEWEAYRQVYHARMSNDLAAKTLREKCVSRDAVKMIVPWRTWMRCGRP
jgi:hypothetical protein